MDYELRKAPAGDDIIYSVYNLEIEKADSSDVLYDVRKQYFGTKKRVKGRMTVKSGEETYKFSYIMERGQMLKWKKYCGDVQCERSVLCEGGYRVESFDKSKFLLKKTFFTREHIFIRAEFFDRNNKIIPSLILTPSVENDVFVLIKSVGGHDETLYPFTELTGKDITAQLNKLSGEPQILCKTNSGTYYYCTKDEIEVRSKTLKELLGGDSEEQASEEIESSFSVDRTENDSIKHIDLSESEAVSKTEEQAENKFEVVANKSSNENVSDEISSAEKTFPKFSHSDENKNVADEKASEPDTEIADENEHTIPGIDDSLFETEPNEEFIASISHSVSEDSENSDRQADDAAPYIYEQVIPQALRETLCSFASDCPYENIPKKEIKTEKDRYFYYGELTDDMRDGRGRTAMEDGTTAYEGTYKDDKRSGFGAYYYKSGKLCFSGYWEDNKREGLGTAYSTDGSCYTGKWHEDRPVGAGASFNSEGDLKYFGTYRDGKRDGAGVMMVGENIVVGIYNDGKFSGKATVFAPSGALLYSGEMHCGERSGKGIEYNSDGTIRYKGEWRGGRYNGQGTLYLSDGGFIEGEFKYGAAEGKGKHFDKNGKLVYEGLFSNNLSSGNGRVYNDDGSYYEGRFSDGEATGLMSEYTSEGELVYSGEWKNGRRSGRGTEYVGEEKVYDGEFSNGVYSGEGRQYSDRLLVYAGSFFGGKRDGCGCEYVNGSMVYRGMFSENEYNGSGITYAGGEISSVGIFKNGKKHGRVNEIKNGKIFRECIYDFGELVYMREYSESGELLYDGNVRNGKRDGFGASFTPFGEKKFEGIFKNGNPQKSMSVILRDIEQLPECEELADGEYDMYKDGTGYVVEAPINDGIYTGKLKNNNPEGKGTILYSDHRFTGSFSEGVPCGEGIIYLLDGEEIRGNFVDSDGDGVEEIKLSNNMVYFCKSIG